MSSHSVTGRPAMQHPPGIAQRIYLYAIIGGGQEREYGKFGIDGNKVYSIAAGKVAAVVSGFSGQGVRPERARLTAHHEVLKRLMTENTPLPMVFGIVAESPAAVRRMLVRNQQPLVGQLERLAGKVEMGLRVTWDVPNIFEYFVNMHRELRVARDQLLGGACAPTQEHKIEVGSMFDRLLSLCGTLSFSLSESRGLAVALRCRWERWR
ncbi:MAG: GvpL/GvpF family gas vesicle protein [Acidobacteriia bacterium]|nr:GvpL/GvpF family gas vesicle protein [Terriglobia bacterium]